MYSYFNINSSLYFSRQLFYVLKLGIDGSILRKINYPKTYVCMGTETCKTEHNYKIN